MSAIGNWIKKSFTREYTNHKGKKKKETVNYLVNDKGEKKHLLNPSQKGRRYSVELKNKMNVFTGESLINKHTKLAYRSGYLKARSDNAKAYNYNKNKRAQSRAAKKGN